MKSTLRLFALIVGFAALVAAGGNATNQIMTYADLDYYIANQTFYAATSATPAPSNQMVTAGQFATYVLNIGTGSYASNQLIPFGDARSFAATPAASSAPTPSPTSSSQITAPPSSRPSGAPSREPILPGQ